MTNDEKLFLIENWLYEDKNSEKELRRIMRKQKKRETFMTKCLYLLSVGFLCSAFYLLGLMNG
jgi:uncharacterized membrane protein YjjP (DUF1212 family)